MNLEVSAFEEGPKEDFEDAIGAELKKDGNVDFDELVAIVKKIAKKYSYKLPKGCISLE